MSWQPPSDFAKRPIALLGAGVLGRRIASTWSAAGYDVHIRDPSDEQRTQCLQYVNENITTYKKMTSSQTTGIVSVFEDMEPALSNVWLIIEAVPEKLDLKIATFATLERLAPQDCILATNSSSYKSSEMITKISGPTKQRVLNTHYMMPPLNMVVELMTDGHTEPAIFPFMCERFRETGALPHVARKESTGFIFNRLWAAIKRETLTILSEGVSDAVEIDQLWEETFLRSGMRPCKLMDDVGLDTVAFIEQHYIEERGLSSIHTVDFLKKNYLDYGKLGSKSEKGGLREKVVETNGVSTAASNVCVNSKRTRLTRPSLIALDAGLSAADPGFNVGEILQFETDDSPPKVLLSSQGMPDGIAVDHERKRMFWTCMNIPGTQDGAVYSSNLDGTDKETLIAPGKINTPKQLCLDTTAHKVYFCDREGCTVNRCDYDGSNFEVLVQNGGAELQATGQANAMNWCVGIAVSPAKGKIYWTQKGPSKGNLGRIFCANIDMPEGKTASSRDDIKCLLYGLPEPIDLDIDEKNGRLYWTDRGELPWGNSLNRIDLNEDGFAVVKNLPASLKELVIARNFNEAIGLQIDSVRGRVYLGDLGGGIYECGLDGEDKKVIYRDEKRAFTGLALL